MLPPANPWCSDPDAVIDGRVIGILQSGFLHGRLVVPRFVLDELQAMADSNSNGTRQRGQRGLDCLERMQKDPSIQVSVHDTRSCPGVGNPQLPPHRDHPPARGTPDDSG
jgi:uncharacterized protein YacL